MLVAIVPAVCNAAATWQSQRGALLAWKSSLGDTAALSTWSRATPTCSWRGVAGNNGGAATMLRLRDLGLSGSLSTLDLNGNNLAGAIPSNISRLRALASLDLGSNGFNGTIPPQLDDG
ncbi:leucine-rich repeat protein 1-like [Miscanthus floridulus]|uniref:leucine-rich repeat protein 1-like n=1 Tax=Miscanthus floridulus TaxID=154761 RepID=UPI00345AB173